MGKISNSNPLSGEVICITGRFSCYPRKKLAEIIYGLGGEFTSRFTARTTLLLKGRITVSKKLGKASKKGVPVIGEPEFCKAFGLNFQLPLNFDESARN